MKQSLLFTKPLGNTQVCSGARAAIHLRTNQVVFGTTFAKETDIGP